MALSIPQMLLRSLYEDILSMFYLRIWLGGLD